MIPEARTKLTELIDLGREVVRASLPTSDGSVVRSLLFLVRGLNAAQSAMILFDAGFEMDAKSVGRVIGECAIEYSFIVCDDEKMGDRLDLYFGHAAHHRYNLARATAKLLGLDEDDPGLLQLKGEWARVSSYYPNEYRWCPHFDTLRKRAREADRMSSATNSVEQHTLEHLYELVYAESCEVAHPGPNSLVDLVVTEHSQSSLGVGPRDPEDERTLSLIALQFGILAAQVAHNVGQQQNAGLFLQIVAGTSPLEPAAGSSGA